MNETNIETEILQKAETLNLEIYNLFCKLDRYKDKLVEPIYKYMSEKLCELYKEEFDRMTAQYFLDRKRERFQAQERAETLAPRRWRPWYFFGLKTRENEAAKLIAEEVEQETKAFFDVCKAHIEQAEATPPRESSRKRELETRCSAPIGSSEYPKTGTSKHGHGLKSKTGVNDQSQCAAPENVAAKAGKEQL